MLEVYSAPLTTTELEAALGRLDASDGLHPLEAVGAIHRNGHTIWPSRCAAVIYKFLA